MNLYGYVGNSPGNGEDVWGLEIIISGDSNFTALVNRLLDKIRCTKKGRELLATLDAKGPQYTITNHNGSSKCSGRGSYQVGYFGVGGRICCGLDVAEFYIANDGGTYLASSERILAHEIGHMRGLNDPKNVTEYENPIVTELGQSSRDPNTVTDN